jgi:hypothetical protein
VGSWRWNCGRKLRSSDTSIDGIRGGCLGGEIDKGTLGYEVAGGSYPFVLRTGIRCLLAMAVIILM